ncbi:type II toxin-antitoxin system PemK/MazF family toxin [Methanogenium cariaci]|jgi:uncharacterized protein YifN (PemK superfamily)
MNDRTIDEGDVFFLDLTTHTGISQNTMKDPHYIAVIMNPRKLQNTNHKTIICVPMTSARSNLWNENAGKPRVNSHHLITPAKYPELKHDTLIKCEQIYTINREYFTDYRFTLDKQDISEVRKRMFNIIGY